MLIREYPLSSGFTAQFVWTGASTPSVIWKPEAPTLERLRSNQLEFLTDYLSAKQDFLDAMTTRIVEEFDVL